MSTHILVELFTAEGKPHLTRTDGIYLVTDDGQRFELEGVIRHRIESRFGEPRKLVLELMRFDVAVAPPVEDVKP